ncbi:efflux RND transporter periplasmic adaptor subunit [Malaciobacter mytili]|uniref:efflux RND transporter periplasmic adaptor subunit n=1 Tax=Malaciobacter mytili TaxID=603050 RepID=UPI000E100117|nr:efflux RND transporter periplasmic adaptor subunit [Malaciobacter mytili]AXH14389.1 RND family efflux system, membrane fusion protein [Malaciobacter mytili LMG 24559]
MIKKVLFVAIVATSLFAQGEALVNTESLKKGKINPLTEFIGSVKFENSSNLASESNGLVKKIFFEVGDKVKKGQTLISIDSSILDAQIKAAVAAVKIAQVELKNATNDYNRYSALLKKDSIAQKSFDDVYLAYEMAKQKVESSNANLKELQIQKDKKSLKAPYDGIIVEKSVNLNEWVSNGTKIAKIVNTTDLEMTFNLPLEYVYQLDKTKKYEISLADTTIQAKLYAAIPSGDTLTRTFPVRFKASIKDKFIFDGAQAKVKLAKKVKEDAFVINRDAVIKRFNQDLIFVIDDKSMANMIPVQIIGFDGLNAGIQAQGLQEGMKVVVKGNERVFPNQPVKVLNK